MITLWQRTGRVVYWLTWPGVWVVLHGSKRARLLVVCGNYMVVTKSWLGTGKWALPGGGLHKGENSLDAALRELYEETGLRLQPRQVQQHSEQVFQKGLLRFNYVLFVSKVKRRSSLRPQPLEISETRWIDRRELTLANAEPDVLEAAEDWWDKRRTRRRTPVR